MATDLAGPLGTIRDSLRLLRRIAGALSVAVLAAAGALGYELSITNHRADQLVGVVGRQNIANTRLAEDLELALHGPGPRRAAAAEAAIGTINADLNLLLGGPCGPRHP